MESSYVDDYGLPSNVGKQEFDAVDGDGDGGAAEPMQPESKVDGDDIGGAAEPTEPELKVNGDDDGRAAQLIGANSNINDTADASNDNESNDVVVQEQQRVDDCGVSAGIQRFNVL